MRSVHYTRGFNSVKQALSEGVPMVVVPISADQPYSAERCVALGVAEAIDSGTRSPDAIRAVARRVLGDASYRASARRFQAEMAALPDSKRSSSCCRRSQAGRLRTRSRPLRRASNGHPGSSLPVGAKRCQLKFRRSPTARRSADRGHSVVTLQTRTVRAAPARLVFGAKVADVAVKEDEMVRVCRARRTRTECR